jgi:hypothetical protein
MVLLIHVCFVLFPHSPDRSMQNAAGRSRLNLSTQSDEGQSRFNRSMQNAAGQSRFNRSMQNAAGQSPAASSLFRVCQIFSAINSSSS